MRTRNGWTVKIRRIEECSSKARLRISSLELIWSSLEATSREVQCFIGITTLWVCSGSEREHRTTNSWFYALVYRWCYWYFSGMFSINTYIPRIPHSQEWTVRTRSLPPHPRPPNLLFPLRVSQFCSPRTNCYASNVEETSFLGVHSGVFIVLQNNSAWA